MLARDVMSPDPVVVVGHDLIAHAAELMRDKNVGFIPVVTDTTSRVLRGVITDRDIAVRCVALAHSGYCRVAEHMTPIVDTVRPEATIADIIAKMTGAEVRRLVVVDERQRPLGIISLTDLALKLGPNNPLAVEAVLEQLSEYAVPLPLPSVQEVLGDPVDA
jgi:CBS domain-containing protein